MEEDWDPFNVMDALHLVPPPPHSFFDPSLEAVLDALPDKQQQPQLLETDTSVSSQHSDLTQLIEDFSDNLLKTEDPLSVLSSDEIFSQIDTTFPDIVDQQLPTAPHTLPVFPDTGIVGAQAVVNDISSNLLADGPARYDPVGHAMASAGLFMPTPPPSSVSSPNSSGAETEEDMGPGALFINRSLEMMDLDIAKLKQEVESVSDEDSLWSDFFSEDDPSEISPEYENLLKSLLTTPVDDIDLSLNVFNSLDEESNDSGEDNSDGRSLVDQVLADHSYTLPWEESLAARVLTPPNSSEESEPEMEQNSSPKLIDTSDLTSKIFNKTVKLKHKKDLKFVFSFKVKDGEVPPSEVNNVNIASQCKRPVYKGVSVLKSNQLSRHSHGSSMMTTARNTSLRQHEQDVLALKRAFKQQYRRQYHSNETALAVQSILKAAGSGGGGSSKHLPVSLSSRALKIQNERELHNSMERQRRIQLKHELDQLKDRIPDIAGNDKVSKLKVLNLAAGYVKGLEKFELKLRQKKHQLREEKRLLIERLAILNQS